MRTTKTTIVPCGATQPCVDECAAAGEAAAAMNVRECDEALRVVGVPPIVDNIAAGRLLLLVDGDRHLTLDGQRVMLGDQALVTLDGELVGAHRVGNLVAIATTTGLQWLRRTDDSYVVVTLAGACPRIALAALEHDTVSASMEALSFDTPYSQWPATLATVDVSHLTTRLRHAWTQTQQTMDAASALGGMVMVRCGVRLMDDTYLWLSEPVALGSETLADAAPVVTDTTLDGTVVTGIPSTTLTRHRYRVGIAVEQGIAADWQPLVRAIDILATTCASPVAAGGTAQYRCIAIGGSVRRPRLEFGLPAVSQGAITSELAQSGWHVIATTSDLASLADHRWVSDAVATSHESILPGTTSYVVTREVEHTDRLTAQQAAAINQNNTPLQPVATVTCNGRLYSIDAGGILAMSRPGNPLSTERQQLVTGAAVRAMMPLSRAIYSNGFGRYPLVLFADDGVYAVPQTTGGSTLGEPRLLDRTVIAPGTRPTEGGRDIYFTSHRGHLCRLRGSEVTTVWRGVGVCQLAWDDAHHELWVRQADGTVLAVMPSGRVSRRTVTCSHLYADTTHALAVSASGQVLDLTVEADATAQLFEWQSHPIVTHRPVEVVWQVLGHGTMTLEVTGERGLSCHGFVVGRLRVSGSVNAPLRQRLVSPPVRTLRLHVSGTATTGTLLLPTILAN